MGTLNANTDQITNRKFQRLNYIDALRGFTILLVVYLHFIKFTLKAESSSNIVSLFWPIRMPLLFCISGFFAYGVFDKMLLKKRLNNRIFKQLWPTICFFILFVIVNPANYRGGFVSSIFDVYKRGYWFTYSLVQVFILFSLISAICYRLKIDKRGQIITYSFVFICCILLNYFDWNYFQKFVYSPTGTCLSFNLTLSYAAWFYFGIVLKLMFENFMVIINKFYFFPVVLLLFIISFLHRGIYQPVTGPVCSMSGILLVISIFYYTRKFWDSNFWLARAMIMVGTATLPVYLFHYFFVHSLAKIPHIGDLSAIVGIHYLEIPIIMVCSIAIAGMCIGIDKGMQRYIPSVHNFIFHSKKASGK